jgi:hypothetical protein
MKTIRTSVTVPEHVWRLLRALAEHRALAKGGKPNASAIVSELIERESRRPRVVKGRDA